MNIKSIVALVCGLVGLILSFFTANVVIPVIALVLAIVGIIFGAAGMKEAKTTGNGRGLAVAGFVLGIIGTVFAVCGVICAIACVAATSAVNDATSGLLNELSSLNLE